MLITGAHHEVRAWRLAAGNDAARLHVVGEGKKKAETPSLSLKRNRFETALERLHDGLPVKGRLKRRFSALARHCEITVEKADSGPGRVRRPFQA